MSSQQTETVDMAGILYPKKIITTLPTGAGAFMRSYRRCACCPDSSGNNYHGIQRGATSIMPGYVPGDHSAEPSGVRFDGVGSYLTADGAAAAFGNGTQDEAVTVIFVAKLHDTTGTQYLWTAGSSGGIAPEMSFRSSGATNWQMYRDDDAGASGTSKTGGTPDTNWHIFTVLYTGTEISLFIDGTVARPAIALDQGICTFNQFTLGARRRNSVAAYANVSFAAQFNYSAALTAANYQGIETWLRANIPGLSNAIASLGHSATAVDPDGVANQELSLHLWDPSHIGREIARSYDLSGNSNHGVQATHANRPVLVGGANAGAHFDGTDDYLIADGVATNVSDAGDTDKAHTHVTLFRINTYATGKYVWSYGKASSATPYVGLQITTDKFNVVMKDDAASLLSSTLFGTSTGGNWTIMSVVFTGTTIAAYENGTEVLAAEAMDPGAITLDRFALAALRRNSMGNYADIEIAAHYSYSSALSSANRQGIETWLKTGVGAASGITLGHSATAVDPSAVSGIMHELRLDDRESTTDSDGQRGGEVAEPYHVPVAVLHTTTGQTAFGVADEAALAHGFTAGVLDSGARQFTAGTANFALTSNPDPTTKNFSVEALVYLDASATMAVFATGSNSNGADGFVCLYNAGGYFQIFLNDSVQATRVNVDGSTAATLATWIHVAWVVDRSGNCTIYVNGVSDGTGDVSAHSATMGTTVTSRIGAYVTPSNYWNGRIARLRYYEDYLLTTDDIAWSRNVVNGQMLGRKASELSGDMATKVVASWDLDETVSDADAVDSTGSNTGTSTNTVTCACGPPTITRGIAVWSEHATGGNSNCGRRHDHTIWVPEEDGTIDTEHRITLVDSGFLHGDVITNTNSEAQYIAYDFIGGTGIDAKITDITSPTTPGVQTDDLGVDWDASVLLGSYLLAAIPGSGGTVLLSFGVVVPPNQMVVSFTSSTGVGPTDTLRGQLTSQMYWVIWPDETIREQASFVSKSGTNIVSNHSTTQGTARSISILALSGVSARATTFTAKGSTGLSTQNTLCDFKPKFGYITHWNAAASASVKDDAMLHISSIVAPQGQSVAVITDEDAITADTDTGRVFSNDEALDIYDENTVQTGEANLENIVNRGVVLSYTAGTPLGIEQIPILLLGDGVGKHIGGSFIYSNEVGGGL